MTRDASRFAEYALGNLAEGEQREFEAELAESDELRRELAAVREALASLPFLRAPALPRPGARDELLAALGSGDRFRPFLADLARCCDLTAARVRELLSRIDDASAWERGPMPGLAFMHFDAGPNAIAHETYFVRLPRGMCFPYHRHAGPEINYVLEGALRDGDGTVYVPGEAMVKAPGTAHECFVPEDADTLIAVVQEGFEVIEKPQRFG
jgi:anti-sigma factor ChrR (cupin superfamily)